MVELGGLEPPTSCMPCKRSPSWAIAPIFRLAILSIFELSSSISGIVSSSFSSNISKSDSAASSCNSSLSVFSDSETFEIFLSSKIDSDWDFKIDLSDASKNTYFPMIENVEVYGKHNYTIPSHKNGPSGSNYIYSNRRLDYR